MKTMKRILATAFLAVFMGFGGSAQSRLAYSEFGVSVGSLNYAGDIATTTNIGVLVSEVRPNVTMFAKRHTNDWFAFGLQASYGSIYAADVNHSNQTRGLEVSTTLAQVNPFLEASLIRFGKYHLERKFTIYLKVGGGFLAYNPQPSAEVTYPAALEPRTDAYQTYNFFYGGGVKFRVSYNCILSLEGLFHKTGADDLDGVAHVDPQNAGANDVYGGVSLGLSYAIF